MDKLEERFTCHCARCGAEMDLMDLTIDNGVEFHIYECLCGAVLILREDGDNKWDLIDND